MYRRAYNTDSLIGLHLKKAITKEAFLKGCFPNGIVPVEEYIEYLMDVIARKNANELEEWLYVMYEAYTFSPFADQLSALLTMDWHYRHEDIASLLEGMALPSTVGSLYATASMSFGYLDYDDTYQLSRKCIKALKSIGSTEAIDSISKLAENSNPVIAGYAKKELVRLGFEDV